MLISYSNRISGSYGPLLILAPSGACTLFFQNFSFCSKDRLQSKGAHKFIFPKGANSGSLDLKRRHINVSLILEFVCAEMLNVADNIPILSNHPD